MHPHDAQSSLDDIRRLQDRTREQVVRQSFALSHVLLAALGLLLGLASVDLQNPWRTAALLLGFGLFVGVGIVLERRALVQRKPTGLEWLFWVGCRPGSCCCSASSESPPGRCSVFSRRDCCRRPLSLLPPRLSPTSP